MCNKLNIIKEVENILDNRHIDDYINSYFCEEMCYTNNEEYKQLKIQYIELFDEICRKLNENDLSKLDDLISVVYEMTNFDIRFAYKIGLVDGISAKNETCKKL